MASAACEVMVMDKAQILAEPGMDNFKTEMDDWMRGVVDSPCPDCGASGAVVRSGWCVTCMDCGWCPCSRR
jgi:hypothetical protein